jgi:hypothetical protein
VFTHDDNATVTAAEIRAYLTHLREERVVALAEGLGGVPTYMDDLDREIAAAREAYVALAVTEVATLRGELFGRQVG